MIDESNGDPRLRHYSDGATLVLRTFLVIFHDKLGYSITDRAVVDESAILGVSETARLTGNASHR